MSNEEGLLRAVVAPTKENYTTARIEFDSEEDRDRFVAFTNDFTVFNSERVLDDKWEAFVWTECEDYIEPDANEEERKVPYNDLTEYVDRYCTGVAQIRYHIEKG